MVKDKKTNDYTQEAGLPTYTPPMIELIEVAVERGMEQSDEGFGISGWTPAWKEE